MTPEVSLLRPEDTRPVDRYVLRHPEGSPFHETRWLDLSRITFGFATQTLVARRGDAIVGVLPLAMVAAPLTGKRLVSVPFGVYGGILADDSAALDAIDESAQELARTSGARYLELRYGRTPPDRHVPLSLYETYRKDLPDDPGDVYATIPRKRRAEVRHGVERHGLRLVEGRHLFEEFYRLYVANKTQLGSPVFSPRYFRALLDLFVGRSALHGVTDGERLLSAVLSVYGGDTIFPYYSGEDPGGRARGANNTMYALLMQDAIRKGLRRFDFGRSRRDSGSARFKAHMGFEPEPLDYRFYFPRGGKPPELNPSNPRMALPRRVIASLPGWLARLAGPTIMRHVP